MLPGIALLLSKVAFKLIKGRIIPKQLGPIRRVPYFMAISCTFFSADGRQSYHQLLEKHKPVKIGNSIYQSIRLLA